MTTTSFPYWTIARDLNKPYAAVLRVLAFLEKNDNAVDYWASLGEPVHDAWNNDVYWRVARAFKAEMARRGTV